MSVETLTPRSELDPTTAAADAPQRGVRALLGVLAVALVAAAWWLPIWQATLQAPQYPGGLTMYAYGNQVTGDIEEIDMLNHYVGMRAFDPADVPEMQLWPVVLALAVVAVVIGLVSRRGAAGFLARAYLWSVPVGILAVIQFRLHQYGHDLEPVAALRLDPFTPWVVGPTKVWNFTTWARPGWGWFALLLAAAAVALGPRLVARISSRGAARTIAVLGVAFALVVPSQPQAMAQEGHQHDHGSHSRSQEGATAPVPAAPDMNAAWGGLDGALPSHPERGDLAPLLAKVADGGRLVLPAGTYRGPVVIDRPVILEGRDLPVIVGDGTGNVITVTAPGTVIRGIAVTGSGPGPTGNPAAIRIEADDVRVEGVRVDDSYMGVAVAGADGAAVLDSVIMGRGDAALVDDGHAVGGESEHAGGHHGHDRGRGDGIWLHDADEALIRNNLVEDARDGIYLSFTTATLVDSNHVHGSRYAMHSMYAEQLTLAENHFQDNLSGAVLMYGGQVLALRNSITGSRSPSTGFGLILKDVAEVQAVQNVLADNRVGLHLDGPAGADAATSIDANTIARNRIGVAAYSSARAAFRANSFVDNQVQVMPQGGSLDGIAWIDRGWGNYWSTYRGYERADLRRGAIPHVEGGSVDRLLLRNPELSFIADAPALRLLRSVEERWSGRQPVAIDHVPLTRPVSPPLAAASTASAVRAATVGVGVALLTLAALVLVPPRRRSTSPRRWPRAVPI